MQIFILTIQIEKSLVTERDPDGEAAGPEAGSELKAPMDIDFAS